MKYTICFLFVLLFCLSCKNSTIKENDVKVEITTAEIISKSKFETKINPFYYTTVLDITDSLPLNKIDIKITNNGTKTYVLYLNENFDNVNCLNKNENIKSIVYQGNEILNPVYFGAQVSWTTDVYSIRKHLNEKKTDSLENEYNHIYLKEDKSFKKIEFERQMNQIIIHPCESKFFTYYRTFPYFLESNFESRYKYNFKKDFDYSFQIKIKNDKRKLLKMITENQQKEINENNYEIFNGSIESNKIPIKFIK